MIFDMFDYEFLKLCGLCRYMPVGLQKRYDAPFLSRSVISNLQEYGFMKISVWIRDMVLEIKHILRAHPSEELWMHTNPENRSKKFPTE